MKVLTFNPENKTGIERDLTEAEVIKYNAERKALGLDDEELKTLGL